MCFVLSSDHSGSVSDVVFAFVHFMVFDLYVYNFKYAIKCVLVIICNQIKESMCMQTDI